MGLHDTEEMLHAAQAQAVLDERENARLRAELTAAEQLIHEQARQLQEQANHLSQAGELQGILWRERRDLEQQLDAVRTHARTYVGDVGEGGMLAERILEIVGQRPAPTTDEHETP